MSIVEGGVGEAGGGYGGDVGGHHLCKEFSNFERSALCSMDRLGIGNG